MDVQKLQELMTLIEESLIDFRHLMIALKVRRAMLPTLAARIDASEVKLGKAREALLQLKRDLGIAHSND